MPWESEPFYKTTSAPHLASSEMFEGTSHTASELTLTNRTTEECLYVSVPIEDLWLWLDFKIELKES